VLALILITGKLDCLNFNVNTLPTSNKPRYIDKVQWCDG
jgi:hypothetical protein